MGSEKERRYGQADWLSLRDSTECVFYHSVPQRQSSKVVVTNALLQISNLQLTEFVYCAQQQPGVLIVV